MSRSVHYTPSGQHPYCVQFNEAIADAKRAMPQDLFMRDVRSSTTDMRKVTCPACLFAVAGMMIRKGVPVEFKKDGKSLYEHFVTVGRKGGAA